MRKAIFWGWDVSAADAQASSYFAIQSVTTAWDRDLFFRLANVNAGGVQKFSVNCYATRADAEAQVNLLAVKTNVVPTGDWQDVALTHQVGAAFDVTPITVRLRFLAPFADLYLWGNAYLYWVADLESLLLERMSAILQQYQAPNEALAILGLTRANNIRLDPLEGQPKVFPAIDLLLDRQVSKQPLGAQFYTLQCGVTLRGWVQSPIAETARDAAVQLGATLRAIAEAQRTWGGFALETNPIAALQPSIYAKTEASITAYCDLPLLVQVADIATFLDPTALIGSGAKYAAAALVTAF